jgi:carboxyl-terminal processing protease
VPYESETRAALKILEEALEKDLYDEALRDDFRRFADLIKDDKMSNMQTYRREIEELIVTEILTRYAYSEGAVEHNVVKDADVERAVQLLLDSEEYNRILSEQDLSKR